MSTWAGLAAAGGVIVLVVVFVVVGYYNKQQVRHFPPESSNLAGTILSVTSTSSQMVLPVIVLHPDNQVDFCWKAAEECPESAGVLSVADAVCHLFQAVVTLDQHNVKGSGVG
ncbi:hypothetical protein WJX77_005393 [Trebouxia sp. C0004]